MLRFFFLIFLVLSLSACSNKEDPIYKPSEKVNPYEIYKEGLNAMKKNDYFFANKKFEKAEQNFTDIDLAARSAIMSVFCLYGINFYEEALNH